MNVREYARAQQRPLGPLRKLIRAVLHAFGVPVTPPQVHEVAVRLYRPTLAAREANYRVASGYLREMAPTLVIPPPRLYPLAAIESAIEKIARDLRIEGDPVIEANRADTRVIETARKVIEGPISRHALQPARETIAKIGEDDDNPHYGWARVLNGPTSCSFCAMLASRGAIYTSREAAVGRGGLFGVYHTPHLTKNGKGTGGFCDCTAVQVMRGSSWEGEAAHLKLKELWNDTAQGKQDPLNEFRREWDQLVRAGKTGVYLPESLQQAA